MAEIKLNKPLYEEKASGCASGECAAQTRQPRAPRAGMLARIGALVIDVLVLHFIGLALIRLVPEALVNVGWAGPWLGLLVASLYFGLGASVLTGGRTVGKLILQLRVVDVTGPELSVGRALVRSAILLWPFVLFVLVDQWAERMDNADGFSLMPLYPRALGALGLGWLLGNVFFASLESHGRTLWDWICGSVVIASDCDPAALGEFMRSARESAASPMPRKPLGALVAVLVAFCGFFVWLLWSEAKNLDAMPAADKERYAAHNRELFLPGFGRPVPVAASATQEADTQTSTAHFQYRYRGKLDVARLKQDPRVMDSARRLAEITVEEIRREMARRQIPLTEIPPRVKFQVGFASYIDLFFAWDAQEVFSVSHTVALRDELGNVGEKATKATEQTTATASLLAGTDNATSTAVEARATTQPQDLRQVTSSEEKTSSAR